MKIGVDVDGVLTELETFVIDYGSKLCFENNVEIDIEPSEYTLEGMFGVDREVDERFWEIHHEYYAENVTPKSFASEILNKLKEEGHEICIITARYQTDKDTEIGERARVLLNKWLSKHKIPYDKIIYSGHEKVPHCLEQKIDVMIDDAPKNLEEISEHLPVICYDAGYNKNYNGSKIYRCYSWYQIYQTINMIEKN